MKDRKKYHKLLKTRLLTTRQGKDMMQHLKNNLSERMLLNWL